LLALTLDRRATRRHAGAWLGCVGLTAAATWLVADGARALIRAHDLYHQLAVAQVRMTGPVLLAVVGVVFVCERIWPAVSRPVRSRAHAVDAAYLGVFVLVAPFVTLLNTGFSMAVHAHARFLLLGRLPLGSQLLVSVLVLVAMDASNWAVHVANHRSQALWRFHALHHSQEEMSVFTTFRTHPLAHASYLPAILPALMLSASGGVPVWAVVGYGCLVTLPHANLRWTYGPLGKVVVSPAYHRLHHAREPVAGKPAVNFGFVLNCWDRLSGLAVDPTRGAPVATGIAGRAVPVEQGADRLTAVLLAQLSQPFRPGQSMGAAGPT